MSQQAGPSSGPLAGTSSSGYTKYASLPDVDTSAPDVYEYEAPARDASRSGRQRSRKKRGEDGAHDTDTDDSSDDSDRSANRKHAGDGKGTSEDIDGSSLKRNDAAAKFSGATDLNADGSDFSGRLHKKRTNRRVRDAGLDTSTYVIDGAAERGPESVVDRLRRLKFEASQLEEDLSAGAARTNSEGAYNGPAMTEQVDSAELLSQLKLLQDQLAKLPAPSVSAPSTSAEGTVDKEALRNLLQQVKQPSASSASDAASKTDAAPAATAPESRTADMAQLEARLSELESTLGLEQALLDESAPATRPVLPTLSRLEHQLSLLSQPRHLDAISRRVKVLVTEMDRVHDTRRKLNTTDAASTTTDSSASTSTLTPAEHTKLQHLFDVSTRLEPLLPVLPSVLARLQTLSDLHSSAAHFGTALEELEDGKTEREQQEQEMEELLRKIEANMEENRGKVEANLESLQTRMEALSERLEKVQGR
ncbi:Dynamitin [Kalmanozyma brasiliensis GHG001]|uniref:Uncharacterized protein n=1 Tax=Kalmanozyma brasiliensis (strain GHG001) TaxID=1365824 RepID=V5F179_KALBG|nr:Dynamitin [Kalmanozyma brasiliensis GHG001]EST09024.1 Dynamitin [Kalmanozyma brasiliensis GHG001]